MRHFLDRVPYEEIEHQPVELPERKHDDTYSRAPIPEESLFPSCIEEAPTISAADYQTKFNPTT